MTMMPMFLILWTCSFLILWTCSFLILWTCSFLHSLRQIILPEWKLSYRKSIVSNATKRVGVTCVGDQDYTVQSFICSSGENITISCEGNVRFPVPIPLEEVFIQMEILLVVVMHLIILLII
jgi:hypothetical protein